MDSSKLVEAGMPTTKHVEAGIPTMDDKDTRITSVQPRYEGRDLSGYDQSSIERVYRYIRSNLIASHG